MRIGLKQWAADNGVELALREGTGKVILSESRELQKVLESAIADGICPCLCDECDEIEPDGHCQHGAPSLLLACGLI